MGPEQVLYSNDCYIRLCYEEGWLSLLGVVGNFGNYRILVKLGMRTLLLVTVLKWLLYYAYIAGCQMRVVQGLGILTWVCSFIWGLMPYIYSPYGSWLICAPWKVVGSCQTPTFPEIWFGMYIGFAIHYYEECHDMGLKLISNPDECHIGLC